MLLYKQIQAWAQHFFPTLPKEEGIQEVKAVVKAALGCSAIQLFARLKEPLLRQESEQIQLWLQRRFQGEPLSRILGHRGFWKHTFQVTSATLDPRPETEGILEQALLFFQEISPPETFLDLGTGTGCILLSLLLEFPKAWGIGIDISGAALKTAQQNATSLGLVGQVTWIQGNWADMLVTSQPTFDLIVSNPPYILSQEISSLSPEVRYHDPYLALDGGEDGLVCYRHLLPQAARLLSPRGCVLLEIGESQGEAVKAIAAPFFQHIRLISDLSQRDRILLAYGVSG